MGVCVSVEDLLQEMATSTVKAISSCFICAVLISDPDLGYKFKAMKK